MVFESNTVSPSNGTSLGRLGLEPVAMTMKSPESVDCTPPSLPRRRRCGDRRSGPRPRRPRPVTLERLVDDLELALHDHSLAVHEVVDGDLVGDLAADPLEFVAGEGVDEQRALAQRLRRDRAPVDARAADDVLPARRPRRACRRGRPGSPPARPPGRSRSPPRRSEASAPAERAILAGYGAAARRGRAAVPRAAGTLDLRPSCTRTAFVPAARLGAAVRGPAARDRRPAARGAALLGVEPPQARRSAPLLGAARAASSTCAAHPAGARARRARLRLVHRAARRAVRDLGRHPARGRPRRPRRAPTPRSSAPGRCSPPSSARPARRCC